MMIVTYLMQVLVLVSPILPKPMATLKYQSSTDRIYIGSWALDIARQVPDTVHIDAIDISARLFPSELPSNVSFKECSVARLPAEWTERFDFVHQRLLAAGILANEWPTVVSEIYRVLRTGGSTQFIELDLMSWPRTTDAEKKLHGGRDALADKIGLLANIGTKIPKLLDDAGFTDVRSEVRYIPLGKRYEITEDGERGSASISGAWKAMKKAILEAGVGQFSSEEEYDKVVDTLTEEWDAQEGGVRLPVYLVYARKP